MARIGKILMVSNFFPPDGKGGAEIVLHNLADALRQRHFEIRVVSGKTESLNTGSIPCIRTLRHHSPPPGNFIGRIRHLAFDEYYDRENAKEIRREIGSFRPDLLYVNSTAGLSHSVQWACMNSRLPVITHLHDIWPERFLLHPTLGLLNRVLYRRLQKKEHLFICVSDSLKQKCVGAGMDPQQMQVVVNALPPDMTAANPALERKTNAVYCGRISRGKGIHVIAEAGLSADIYGSGEASYLKECVDASHGKLRHCGVVQRHEVISTLTRYPCLLMPSISYEACPLVILEAMAAGCVPIASDIGGIPELIGRGDAAAGMLVAPGDASGFGAAAHALLNDENLRRRYASRGIERVKKYFAWARFVDEIEGAIGSLINA